MSDPLVHRHDPAATPSAGPGPDAPSRSAPRPDPAGADDHAARVVTLAQLLATEAAEAAPAAATDTPPDAEVGGPKGPEPTRYGDWEKGGRCIDF